MQDDSPLQETLLQRARVTSVSHDEPFEENDIESSYQESDFEVEADAPSPFSRLGFVWFSPVLRKSAKAGKLELRDLPALPGDIQPGQCKRMVNSALNSWNGASPMTFWRLASAGGLELVPLMLLRLTADAVTLMGPLILGKMLKCFDLKPSLQSTASLIVIKELVEGSQSSRGASIYAGMFLLTFVMKSFLESHFSFRRGVLKEKIQSGLTSHVFTHIISESHQNVGKIQNLMSIDTDRASNVCLAWIDVISMVVQLSGALCLLYINMAWTCIVGVTLVVIMIPVNHVIAGLIKKASRQMMAAKDIRASLLSDFFHSIRAVKAYGWEAYFKDKVKEIRSEEVHNLKIIKYSDSVCVFLWAMTSLLMSAGTFSVWSLTGKKLTAERVYPTLSLFNIIILPINAIPWVINGIMESYVSLARLNEYIVHTSISHGEKPDRIIKEAAKIINCHDARFSHRNHRSSNQFCLDVPNLLIDGNERILVSVQGNIGSGKSSLLMALLGEMECLSGEPLNAHKSITYAPQTPFLVPGSIMDNIIFGSEFEVGRYEEVISACCLKEDFLMLEGGDKFEVQDLSDLSLSGGQKARIMLARALYPYHSSLILVDDVLASLDAKLSIQILKKAILGDLTRNKTIVIVTNCQAVLAQTHFSITVDRGLVIQRRNTQNHLNFSEENRSDKMERSNDSQKLEGFREVSIEDREKGSVSYKAYKYYFDQQGIWTGIIISSLALMQLFRNASDIWLSYNLESESNLDGAHGQSFKNDFMSIYLILVAICGGLTLIRSFSFAFGGLKSATKIHTNLLETIFEWDFIRFLSSNSGQMMNRMVTDIAFIDDSLPFILNIYFAQVFGIIGVIITLLVSQQKYLAFMAATFLALFFWFRSIQKEYTACTRELKRLESIFKSPLFSFYQSVCDGSVSIRAFRREEYFEEVFEHHLTNFLRALYASNSASAWLSLRLQMMSSVVAASVVAIGLFAIEYGTFTGQYSSLIGLSLSYLLPITSLLGGLVTSASEVEREMVSVERVLTYISKDDISKRRSSDLSVLNGDILVHLLSYRYPKATEFALKGINLRIPEFKRCVICGRSGSGKSTLISCLLGLLPVDSGSIFFGGRDIQGIPQSILRANIGYMPQEPVIFSGSIRENLDPYKKYKDQDLIKCMQLTGFVQRYWKMSEVTEHMLSSKINSSVFSTAEKSLLSLSRLLLQRPSYLFLDEPSAAMSEEDLRGFGTVLDSLFRDATIIESAHRLTRASSADLITILSRGEVIETGNPGDLMQKDSEYLRMMQCYIGA